MSKHTPGPWVAIEAKLGAVKHWIIAEKQYNGFQIASTATDEVEQGEANARLIAAAPELLEMAKHALADLDAEAGRKGHEFCVQTRRELRFVIAKAEGRDE